VPDAAIVGALLAPFPGDTAVDSAVITRHELLGLPSRPAEARPDAFAVDAEQTFRDFSRRLG
jgi:hypothetical protein